MGHHHACTDPQHHVDDAEGFVSEVERVCEARGLRLTPIRAPALRLIAAADRPVKAYELLDLMTETHGAAAPPTGYRAPELLPGHGCSPPRSSTTAVVGCCPP